MYTMRLILTLILTASLAACAHDSERRMADRSRTIQCRAGETLVCEVSNTGRIHHGSFSKGNSRCTCKDDRGAAPIIPAIH